MSDTQRTGVLGRVLRGFDLTRRVVVNLLFLIVVLVILVLAFSSPDKPEVERDVALVLNPSGLLVDQKSGTVVDRAMDRLMGQERPETLVRDVVRAIRLAADDDRVSALVLNLNNLHGGGLSKLQTVADELSAFRDTGKPVYALGDRFTQSQYFLAAQADEIFMHPGGMVLLTGFETYRNYYKGAIDMLDAEWNIFRVGEYKSFVEPYMRADMSDEDREARLTYLTSLWDAWLEDVAERRGMGSDDIQNYINGFPERLQGVDGDYARLTLELGLVDALLPRDAMRDRVMEVTGKDENNGSFRQISMGNYLEAMEDRKKRRRGGQIAVIPAVGPIMDGFHPPGTVGGDSTAALIREARRDDSVKAVVLLVDSPGGSAFASDVILRELELVQEAGKPVVASMGSVAASGGYWISMAADEIWAHPTTVTGSIGILSMFPTFEGTLDKIGITTDGVGTTEMSGAFRADRTMEEPMRRILQQGIEHGYREFIEKVAHHREMSLSEVDAVARGRVWSGVDAHRAGLVDHLGKLEQAIESAAALAELDEWHVRYREREPTWREQLIADFLGGAGAEMLDFTERRLHQAPHRRVLEQLRRDLEQLDAFNDPNHLYYYCDACVIRDY
ncbi:signal peptide peptidase SppA [Natronospira bacteriovora]|uniref:Signal peptide peptidase SppA n=1 Tax=Natronospira bacteriovora TaxID=3069753 RepID=A0ABU0W521_9GAMM|nr:signal peptide peptidase SppA [Natronospira sp. AB-CW4]MDQ2068863.1 signal peptide peptidase SppA [Natronospira sp. AB-CW4]